MPATLRKTRPEPTREQLALAFRQLRRPDRWPATLDAALAHPTLGTCLRAMARNISRPAWQAHVPTATLPRGLPVPPTPTDAPLSKVAPRGTALQAPQFPDWKSRPIAMKRAAANDRDD